MLGWGARVARLVSSYVSTEVSLLHTTIRSLTPSLSFFPRAIRELIIRAVAVDPTRAELVVVVVEHDTTFVFRFDLEDEIFTPGADGTG